MFLTFVTFRFHEATLSNLVGTQTAVTFGFTLCVGLALRLVYFLLLVTQGCGNPTNLFRILASRLHGTGYAKGIIKG